MTANKTNKGNKYEQYKFVWARVSVLGSVGASYTGYSRIGWFTEIRDWSPTATRFHREEAAAFSLEDSQRFAEPA
jgi:hypothetical protein